MSYKEEESGDYYNPCELNDGQLTGYINSLSGEELREVKRDYRKHLNQLRFWRLASLVITSGVFVATCREIEKQSPLVLFLGASIAISGFLLSSQLAERAGRYKDSLNRVEERMNLYRHFPNLNIARPFVIDDDNKE